MNELIQSALTVRKVAKGSIVEVVVPTKKGGQVAQPVSLAAASVELHARIKAADPSLDKLAVEFELVDGRVSRLRLAGQPFQGVSAAAKTHTSGTNSKNASAASAKTKPTAPSSEFHNPYNFIRALSRDKIPIGNPLADMPPKGHDRYHAGFWSGRLTVILTAETPLLIPDASKIDPSGNEAYDARIDDKNEPLLPPTSVKGMLRSAYEAITNSRFGVFSDYRDPFGYRRETDLGAKLVPVRIESDSAGQMSVRLLPGDVAISSSGLPDNGADGKSKMYAAWLRRYKKSSSNVDKGQQDAALRYADQTMPQHGECVDIKVNWQPHKVWKKKSNGEVVEETNFHYQEVINIQRASGASPPAGMQRGWVCLTGANIGNKHHERVFLLPSNPPAAGADPYLIPLVPGMRDAWNALIADYQAVNDAAIKQRQSNTDLPKEKRAPSAYLGNEPGETAWSAHIHELGRSELVEGALCYASVSRNADGQFEARRLYPVMLSRDVFSHTPDKLLHPTLKPARRIEELSPADRVFGWVNQGTHGRGAYRGQLRIHNVKYVSAPANPVKTFNPPLVLSILGAPKPQQGRFYVGDAEGRAQQKGQSKAEAGYNDDTKRLRGRKVYPHHADANAIQNYWIPPSPSNIEDIQRPVDGKHPRFFYEYLQPDAAQGTQNRSIRRWVEPKTVFSFSIDVINLSDEELGALLWLLTLDADHYLRLGGGKPFGFGSVRVEVVQIDVRNGEAWRNYYGTLGNSAPSIPPAKRMMVGNGTDGLTRQQIDAADDCVKAYDVATASAFNTEFMKLPFIEAFLCAARGFKDRLPIHYPRGAVARSADGKNYTWFTTNDQRSKKNPQAGQRLALGDLVDDQGKADSGLPLFSDP